jgi:hypothetical protein
MAKTFPVPEMTNAPWASKATVSGLTDATVSVNQGSFNRYLAVV